MPDGSCDVTAHVAWTRRRRPAGPPYRIDHVSARRCGRSGSTARRPPLELARTDPAGYLRALAAAGAAAELTDPAGLGGHWWLLHDGRHRRRGTWDAWLADMSRMRLREMTVGTGAGLDTADMVLNIGPQHPSTHGVLRLKLALDGERVVSCEPIVGYMHRGAEKLFEVRDYRQIIVLANRHDWLSAFANELGVVLAVERLMGIEVPERAVWLRMALAELNRVLNHLMFLGSYPLEIGAITPDVLRVPRAGDAAGGDGGGLRRPDALHVQPGRRPQGGGAGRLDPAGPGGDRRWSGAGCPTSTT